MMPEVADTLDREGCREHRCTYVARYFIHSSVRMKMPVNRFVMQSEDRVVDEREDDSCRCHDPPTSSMSRSIETYESQE